MTERGSRVLASFTKKECAIVQALALGLSNREIAGQLQTTEQVIKNYLRSIFDKTGMNDRLHLVVFCFYHGIVQCPCPQGRATR